MRNFSGILGTGTLLLLSATLAAQAPGTGNAVVLMGPLPSGACPVGFSARHANVGVLLNVSPAEKPQGPAYSLRFVPRHAEGITGAKVTLHGISGHHVIPAGSHATAPSSQTTEAFTLALSSDGSHLFTSVVYPGSLTGVTSIELNELTFADGTRWHEKAESPCEIAPNGYMLVAGRQAVAGY